MVGELGCGKSVRLLVRRLLARRRRRDNSSYRRLFACAGAGVLAIACGSDEPVGSGQKAKILFVGDSIAANSHDTVKSLTEGTHRATLHESIFPGTALCDFIDGKPEVDPPFLTKLPEAIRTIEPQLVVLQFWGNGATPCMRDLRGPDEYFERYFLDAVLATEQIESSARLAGIPRPKLLWVLQGPEPNSSERTRRLNEGYTRVAQLHGDRTTDAGWTVSEAARPNQTRPDSRYTWTQFLPCTDHEKANGLCTHPEDGLTQLHANEDPVHFCLGAEFLHFCATPSPAAVRYGSRIAGDAIRWLGS